jgi:uncharacterized protein YndB with AHSA1/START domain
MDSSTLPANLLLNIRKEIVIEAPASVVFDSVIEQAGPGMIGMDGKSMNLSLEAWPGGRWFRDLGNKTGHLWGHVQVIKPPTLLELNGPMFMSYPAISHIQYKLTENAGVTTLTLTHRAIGDIAPEHRENVGKGWDHVLSQIKNRVKR